MISPTPVFTNVSAYLSWMALKNPDRPAVYYPGGREKTGRILYRCCTFGELDSESNRLADGLLNYGLAPGMRTVLMVTPGREFFALTFALLKAGIVPVLVDPGMGVKNLKTCLAEAEPGAFIGITKAHIARVILGWGKKSIEKLVTVGPRLGWSGATFDQISSLGTDRQFFSAECLAGDMEDIDPETIASINFTSGSTGVPKGAVYTHGVFAAQVALIRNTYGITSGETDLCTFPLFALFAPALGMTSVVPDMDASRPADVNPLHIIQAMEDYQPTNMFGSPALLTTVGRYCESRGVTFPSLKRVISAGAPIRPEILKKFTTVLNPDKQIFSGYGATEAMPLASIGSHEILSETAAGTDNGDGVCVGISPREIDLSIMKIIDDPVPVWDPAMTVPQGEIGEIVAQGPVVTREYFHRPESTALAKMKDSDTGEIRHRMGDLGYFDEKGRLWFCGRKAHRVETPDKIYFSVCCEGVFNTHPAVFRSALVGILKKGKIVPVLCVEREKSGGNIDDTELIRVLKKLAVGNDVTRGIEYFLIHRQFPVDIRHNSKIFREKLAVWAEKRLR